MVGEIKSNAISSSNLKLKLKLKMSLAKGDACKKLDVLAEWCVFLCGDNFFELSAEFFQISITQPIFEIFIQFFACEL